MPCHFNEIMYSLPKHANESEIGYISCNSVSDSKFESLEDEEKETCIDRSENAQSYVLVSSLLDIIYDFMAQKSFLMYASNGNDSYLLSKEELNDGTQNVHRKFSKSSFSWSLKKILHFVGPGWLVAMAYIDPGNLEGDLVAGAYRDAQNPQAGFHFLWILMFSTLIGFFFQHLAVKLGIYSSKTLAELCREIFPRSFCYIFWAMLEISLLGADIQCVMGSAISLKLLFNVPFSIGILLTLFDCCLAFFLDIWGPRRLETCFALCISLMGGCFFINMFTSHPSLSHIIHGLTCFSIPKNSLPLAISLIGSVVMPHNFFLQSAVVQSRLLHHRTPELLHHVTHVYTIETFFLLSVSFLVNLAVVVAFANPGITSSQPLTLYNAHVALKSSLGQHSALIWGIGLLASGQCATIASTYASRSMIDGFLQIKFPTFWSRVLVTRLTSLIPLLILLKLNTASIETIANSVNVLQVTF
ncbi:metal transporter nramp1 homolog isoform X2 [Hylaeus volcanicus]|uniref:metal transporter nramp1 homolog isoform X2 n=1 Tax=Hylaeus volcanicus TaxID=313075 RepID=UPI0023B85B57|nr:metal transporter nramp1 homolog isoform X2 [Hylaeus volcanicus]